MLGCGLCSELLYISPLTPEVLGNAGLWRLTEGPSLTLLQCLSISGYICWEQGRGEGPPDSKGFGLCVALDPLSSWTPPHEGGDVGSTGTDHVPTAEARQFRPKWGS